MAGTQILNSRQRMMREQMDRERQREYLNRKRDRQFMKAIKERLEE